MSGELILPLLFFPLFGILGGALLALSRPAISAMIKSEYQDRFYGAILLAALFGSLLLLSYLNCWLLIEMPFMEKGCSLIGF